MREPEMIKQDNNRIHRDPPSLTETTPLTGFTALRRDG